MPIFVGAGTSSFMKGDGGVGVSTMTTAERNSLSGVKKGQIIFNESLNLAQYYDGVSWKSIDSPPIINNFTLDGGSAVTSAVIDASAGGNATIVINGSLFDTTAATVSFVGTSETLSTASITRNSTTQLTVTVARSGFDNTNEPYAIKVLNGSGLSATLADAINQDRPPVFNTAAGNLNSAFNTVAYSADAGATDPDGDTVTHSITSGSLPSGLSINSTNGAITGTPSGSSEGNYAITVQAATSNATVTRNFVVPLLALPTGGSISVSGNYRIHHFTNNGDFVNPNAAITGADVLVVGGGGGGGAGLSVCANNWYNGGGGGAGGLRYENNATLPQGTSAISIGGGGAGANANQETVGAKGGNTTAFGYTGFGGGGGESRLGQAQCSESASNLDGGSGGGRSDGGGRAGDATQSPGFGNEGGTGQQFAGGGGGGAGGAGENATSGSDGGEGGAGRDYSTVFGSTFGESGFFAGGGGGGSAGHVTTEGGQGGSGGGGTGRGEQTTKTAGDDATGGGGGGGSPESSTDTDNDADGSPGGSGVVLIRYNMSTLT